MRALTDAWNFEVPSSTNVKAWLGKMVAHEQEGLQVTQAYGYSLFMLMKTYAAKGDIEHTRRYASKYARWKLVDTGKPSDPLDVQKAFGMVAVAEMVQRMRGKMKAKKGPSAAK